MEDILNTNFKNPQSENCLLCMVISLLIEAASKKLSAIIDNEKK